MQAVFLHLSGSTATTAVSSDGSAAVHRAPSHPGCQWTCQIGRSRSNSIVVNNAGIQPVAPIEEFADEAWDAGQVALRRGQARHDRGIEAEQIIDGGGTLH